MREQADTAEQLMCSRKQTELTLQDSQHAHNCKIEVSVAVFNMLTTVNWAGSINQSNAQQFDSLIIKSQKQIVIFHKNNN